MNLQLNYTIIGIAVFSENKKPPAFANRRWWLFDLLSLGVLYCELPSISFATQGAMLRGSIFILRSSDSRLPSPFAN